MDIRLELYDDVEEIWEFLTSTEYDGESGISNYHLKKRENEEYMCRTVDNHSIHPFIYFPDDDEEKEEDGKYHISVCSGSHVAWYDFDHAMWMWMFWFAMIREMEARGINFEYSISADGEEEGFDINGAWKKILNENPELEKYVGWPK